MSKLFKYLDEMLSSVVNERVRVVETPIGDVSSTHLANSWGGHEIKLSLETCSRGYEMELRVLTDW